MTSLPPLLLGSALLLGLLLLSAALGRLALRCLGLARADDTARLILSTGLGLGLLQFVPFTLLAFGVASPGSIRATLLALTIILLPSLLSQARLVPAGFTRIRSWSTWEKVIVAILACFLVTIYLRALCPITDDDGLSYHLSAAVRLLEAGRFVYLPTLTYTNWPLGVESLYMLFLGVHPHAPVGLVQFAYGIVTLSAAWSLGRRLGGPATGALTAALLLGYKIFWLEATQAHVDVGTALFATLAIYALWNGQKADNYAAWLRTSAVFAGLAATTKLLGVWVIFAVALVVLTGGTDGCGPPPSRRQRLRRAAFVATIGLIVLAPWLVRTWAVTGNPLYPMVYQLFGGKEWTAEGWPRIQYYFLLLNTPPGTAPTQVNLLLSRGVLVACSLAIGLLVWRVTRNSRLAIPARFAAAVTAGIFLGSGYNLRFLLVAYPSVCLCAATGLARLRTAPRLAIGLAVCFAITTSARFSVHLPTAISVATGATSRQAYLRASLPDYAVVEYANSHLPKGAVILVGTWEEANAYYRPLALRANYWLQDSVHYDSPKRLDGDLRRLGVGFLVLRPMEPRLCDRSSVCHGRDITETRSLFDLAARRGVKLFQSGDVALYRLQ